LTGHAVPPDLEETLHQKEELVPKNQLAERRGRNRVREDLGGAAKRRRPVADWVRCLTLPSAIGLSVVAFASCGGDTESNRGRSAGCVPDDNGVVDCSDSSCSGHPDCVVSILPAGETDCTDDEDCSSSSDCAFPVMPPPEENCTNGVDDDEDGDIDCMDADCAYSSPDCFIAILPPGETDCGNGLDDDRDGPIDCQDIALCAQ
jgi:hypothetical protein